MIAVDPSLHRDVLDAGAFDASACLNCGVCTATCPLGLELLPRRLFRVVLLGLRERLADEEEAVLSCLLCRACEERCPARVPIAENVRSVRRHLTREIARV